MIIIIIIIHNEGPLSRMSESRHSDVVEDIINFIINLFLKIIILILYLIYF